jgi:hypothetical protein
MCDTNSSCYAAESAAECPAGDYVTGGGFYGDQTNPPFDATTGYTGPIFDSSTGDYGWGVVMVTDETSASGYVQTFAAVADCVGGSGLQANTARTARTTAMTTNRLAELARQLATRAGHVR